MQLEQVLVSPLEGPAAMVAAALTGFAVQETHRVNWGVIFFTICYEMWKSLIMLNYVHKKISGKNIFFSLFPLHHNTCKKNNPVSEHLDIVHQGAAYFWL